LAIELSGQKGGKKVRTEKTARLGVQFSKGKVKEG